MPPQPCCRALLLAISVFSLRGGDRRRFFGVSAQQAPTQSVADVAFADEDGRANWFGSAAGVTWAPPADLDGVDHYELYLINLAADDPTDRGRRIYCCDHDSWSVPTTAPTCSPGLAGCPKVGGAYIFRQESLPGGAQSRLVAVYCAGATGSLGPAQSVLITDVVQATTTPPPLQSIRDLEFVDVDGREGWIGSSVSPQGNTGITWSALDDSMVEGVTHLEVYFLASPDEDPTTQGQQVFCCNEADGFKVSRSSSACAPGASGCPIVAGRYVAPWPQLPGLLSEIYVAVFCVSAQGLGPAASVRIFDLVETTTTTLAPVAPSISVLAVEFVDADRREGWIGSYSGISWILPELLEGVTHLEVYVVPNAAANPAVEGHRLYCCNDNLGYDLPTSATRCAPGIGGCPVVDDVFCDQVPEIPGASQLFVAVYCAGEAGLGPAAVAELLDVIVATTIPAPATLPTQTVSSIVFVDEHAPEGWIGSRDGITWVLPESLEGVTHLEAYILSAEWEDPQADTLGQRIFCCDGGQGFRIPTTSTACSPGISGCPMVDGLFVVPFTAEAAVVAIFCASDSGLGPGAFAELSDFVFAITTPSPPLEAVTQLAFWDEDVRSGSVASLSGLTWAPPEGGFNGASHLEAYLLQNPSDDPRTQGRRLYCCDTSPGDKIPVAASSCSPGIAGCPTRDSGYVAPWYVFSFNNWLFVGLFVANAHGLGPAATVEIIDHDMSNMPAHLLPPRVALLGVGLTDDDPRESWIGSSVGLVWALPEDLQGVTHLEAYLVGSVSDDPISQGQRIVCCDGPSPNSPDIPIGTSACAPTVQGTQCVARGASGAYTTQELPAGSFIVLYCANANGRGPAVTMQVEDLVVTTAPPPDG